MTAEPDSDLRAATDDLKRVVEYRRRWAAVALLPLLLGLAALALGAMAFAPRAGGLGLMLLAVLALVLARMLWLARPWAPPDLVLTPEGLRVQIGRGALALGWSDIQAVETGSFEGFAPQRYRRNRMRFDDVTMIRLQDGILSRLGLRGRSGWFGQGRDWLLRHDDRGDSVALHHQWLGLTPAEVRGPVEARWRAWRDAPAPAAASPLPPLRLGGFDPAHPGRYWGAALATGGLVVALALNLAGVWETAGQRQARLNAERWQAHRAEERATQRDLRGEADARARQMEERMQRAFPGVPPVSR